MCTGWNKPAVEGTIEPPKRYVLVHTGICPDCGMRVQVGVLLKRGMCYGHLPKSDRLP